MSNISFLAWESLGVLLLVWATLQRQPSTIDVSLGQDPSAPMSAEHLGIQQSLSLVLKSG